MEAAEFFIQLAGILVAARIAGELAIRLGAPSVIGELTAGIVLGPSLLGWLQINEIIHLLAEIGIILLLFEVGLETDIGRLAPGARADLALVDLTHPEMRPLRDPLRSLVHSAGRAAVRDVYVDGVQVVRSGEVIRLAA